MKIYLVYPNLNSPYFFPPLGIVYLATYLKERGISAELIDLVFSTSYDDYIERIKTDPPDIVGISVLTSTIGNAFELAKKTKELYPGCKVVLGGPHATAMPEHSLGNENVDFIVIGEGEETFYRLVKALSDGSGYKDVKGIGYKSEGRQFFTETRPFIENIDELPMPDRDLLPTYGKYLKHQTSFPFFMPCGIIIVSRGCPFHCTFCQPMLSRLYGKKVRHISPENVIASIKHLVDRYKIKSVYFTDDTFWADPEWAKKVCRLLIENGLNKKLYFLAQTNLVTLTEERVRLMSEAGFVYLAFGVESGNEEILKKTLRKAHAPQTARTIFALCRKHGIVTSAFFLIGSPGETKENIADSVRLMEDLNPDIKDVNYLRPTPGSLMYEQCVDNGLISVPSGGGLDFVPDMLETETLKKEDIYEAYRMMTAAYLKNKSLIKANRLWFAYMWNVLARTGNPRALFRVIVLQYLMKNSRLWFKIGSALLEFRDKVLRRGAKKPLLLD